MILFIHRGNSGALSQRIPDGRFSSVDEKYSSGNSSLEVLAGMAHYQPCLPESFALAEFLCAVKTET